MKFTFPGYLTFLLLSPSILLKEEEISGPPNSLELLDLEPIFEKQEKQRLFFSVKCSPMSSQHASGNVCVEHVREKLSGTASQCLSSQVRGIVSVSLIGIILGRLSIFLSKVNCSEYVVCNFN